MALAAPGSVLIYGCGRMGEAILKGWLGSEEGIASQLSQDEFTVLELSPDRAETLARTYGVTIVDDVSQAAPVEMIVLAVKPQTFPEVLPRLKDALETAGKPYPLIVSIAAGVPTSDIEEALGNDVHVVRVMPNMPLQVGAGASVVSAGSQASDEDVDMVRQLFACLGEASVVDEDQIDAVCAISGGGPAYFAYMVELLRDAGVKAGLDADLAESLAQTTLYGTGLVLQQTDQDAESLRKAVCSPGGTTLAALSAMDENGIEEAIDAGVQGAIARAKELATC